VMIWLLLVVAWRLAGWRAGLARSAGQKPL